MALEPEDLVDRRQDVDAFSGVPIRDPADDVIQAGQHQPLTPGSSLEYGGWGYAYGLTYGQRKVIY